jgi:signal transduction histidine kinase/DNA-binding response OmpR family regulator
MPKDRWDGLGLLSPEALRRDLGHAYEHMAATNQVLRSLGRPAPDFGDVFSTVVDSARRLCRGDAAQLYLADDGSYRLAWHAGVTDEYRAYLDQHPLVSGRGSVVGRVALSRRTEQITDVLADHDYARLDAQRLGHFRTIIGAPMLVENDVVGVLVVWRTRVDPFDQRSADQLTSFAAQAAVAVRTVGLMRALEERSSQLAEKVDQMQALSAVGEAVSSSLDLDEVLATIITHAVELSGTDGGSVFEFDAERQEFRLRTTVNTEPALQQAVSHHGLGLHDTLVGRAARERRPLQVADLTEAADDVHLRTLLRFGWLSLVVVPMVRHDRIIGALVVRRRTPGAVGSEMLELLQTFATQSSAALANAQLYRRLEQQSAELAVVSQHKSDFLASMSHELRTPLNAIIGFSDVLLERMFGDLNERQDEYLRDIHSSGRHLLALLNDILDLSKVEAGQMQLDRHPVDVEELLAATVPLVRERAQRHGLEVQVEVGESGLLIDADELRLRQVLLNLLTNAVKFTPDGGSVGVRAERQGDGVAFTVTDTGIGVAEADRGRIFESFQQGGRSMSAQEGTGLGLTLSRRIVELHGGHMWLESEVGEGSTFGFSVPLDVPVTAPASGTRRVDGAVLVVEDDPRSASLMTALLEAQGLAVEVAGTGEQALERLQAGRPLAVVLDIRLPGMDGWDVLRRVKGDADTADIPVIIVSMLDEPGRGLALGADDYLVKPVARELLVAALERTGVISDQPGRRVLLVDADPADADGVAGQLERAGWSVDRVGSLAQGQAAAQAQRPDVVLIDLVTGIDNAADAGSWTGSLGDVPVVAIAPAGAGQWRLVAEHLNPAEARWTGTDALPGLLEKAVARARAIRGASDGA